MGTVTPTEEELLVVTRARESADEWIGWDSDIDDIELANRSARGELPVVRMRQVQLARWQNRMPWTTTWATFALGMSEELYELHDALEKLQTVIVNSPEETRLKREVIDALCDILIFGCNAATALRLDFCTLVNDLGPLSDEEFASFEAKDPLHVLPWGIGAFAHVVLKEQQKIRGFDDIEKARTIGGCALRRIFTVVRYMLLQLDHDAFVAFDVTAKEVLARDFNKNKVTG
jgi:NTP pyrophosphatase (non-canonical NTP hydrolase)